MTLFPSEPSSSTVSSKYEELEHLYAHVGKTIYEGLTIFEKNASASPSSLFGTLMMLKAACINNPGYIDRLISTFMRVMQRLCKEHLNPTIRRNLAESRVPCAGPAKWGRGNHHLPNPGRND